MRIVTIVGARPQFIKALAISKECAAREGVEEILLHTGQHYDENMSGVFFKGMGIPEPKYRFSLGGGSHGDMTGRQLTEIEKVLMAERPDVCLVYGDTNSTLAGALAAAKLNIPVAHVEAGLRSFNRRMPEEVNRVLTDHASTWLFAPSDAAVQNLANEGIDPAMVHRVGDVMYDVTLMFQEQAKDTTFLQSLGLAPKTFAVATIHRQESTDDPSRLLAILGALSQLASEMPVILPVHPRTHKVMEALPKADAFAKKLMVTEPLDFNRMASITSHAALVVTDSGGLQKEAYFHRIPCVTVRDETEWVELVEMGWNRLPKSLSQQHIYQSMQEALVAPRGDDRHPYGNGSAARSIIDILQDSIN